MSSLEKKIVSIPKALFSKELWRTVADYMGLGKAVSNQPLTDLTSLQDFLRNRASHVAQSSLYGYLKTRAGTRFPEMFENPGLLLSINMAKWQIWLACLSDLTVYMGGLLYQRTQHRPDEINRVLGAVIDRILEETGIPEESADEFSDSAEAVRIRVINCDYSTIADDETAFVQSPDSLYHWAPIDDELKKRDKLIVRNSVRFRWQEIRRTARNLLQADELMANSLRNIQ